MEGADTDTGSDTSVNSWKSASCRARLGALWGRCSVALVFFAFVVIRAADRVFGKRVSNALLNPTYTLMLWNMIWPLSIQVMFVFCVMAYVLAMRRAGHAQYTWRFFLPGNAAASTAGAVPLFHFAFISLGDQLQAAMQGPTWAFISQTMLSVMCNTTIIWVLMFASLFLGTRYKQVHYIGCLLVVLSILVGLSTKLSVNDCSPQGLEKEECLTAYKGNDDKFHILSMGETLLWFGLFLLSNVPGAAGAVYKQYVLQDRDADIVYAKWWSGNFQVLWGWLCIWMLWIKLPGQNLTPEDTFQAFSDTWSCLNGDVPHIGDESCAQSPTPMFWFRAYLTCNVAWHVLFLWLTKHLSAAWATIASVLCLDLTNIFGMMPFIAGGGAEMMLLNDWLATALASVALWVYSLEKEVRPEYGNSAGGDLDEEGGEAELPSVPEWESQPALSAPKRGIIPRVSRGLAPPPPTADAAPEQGQTQQRQIASSGSSGGAPQDGDNENEDGELPELSMRPGAGGPPR